MARRATDKARLLGGLQGDAQAGRQAGTGKEAWDLRAVCLVRAMADDGDDDDDVMECGCGCGVVVVVVVWWW